MRLLYIAGYLAIPAAFLVHFLARDKHWEPTTTFFLAALGVVPLAHLMGESTEELSARAGPTWGGLLNATFGNAAELIIGVIALSKGLNGIVKASLTGSILGNLLLVSGCAMVVGGWRRDKQTFSRPAAEANAGLLVVAVAAMLLPAIFHFTAETLHDQHLAEHEHAVSIGTSVILLIVYALGLLFTLKTHAHLFSTPPPSGPEGPQGMQRGWSARKSVLVLLAASAGIGVVAELLVGSAETMAKSLGWNHVFVGVILLAIIGNAAEHSTALMLAHRNDMDTAMTITYQSSVQIALFATPFLVLCSSLFVALNLHHARHMDLVFTPLEVVAVVLTVMIVIVLLMNGETNWFEGAMLLALYGILGITFFYIPPTGPDDAPQHEAKTEWTPATTPQTSR
jgi:Ca2+:H+ antiporter